MRRPAERWLGWALAALIGSAIGCTSFSRPSSPTIQSTDPATAPYSTTLSPTQAWGDGADEAAQNRTTAQLYFLDRYQPGKVPVVLVHGLFSSPDGWKDMIGHLRAAPYFCERFQIWAFAYPTTQGFLQSAAALRGKMRTAVATLDPQQADPALRRMVLIGHSMGGLIAKLQVAYSEEHVWSRVANRPLETIVTTEFTRAFLAETCYFDPSPHISRVVFIASPHCGSLCSSSAVGHCVSSFIRPTPAQAELHSQLVRDNPQTFNPVIERRFPTSIDMLTPRSPLLDAMHEMRLRQGVALHTIMGVSHPLSLDGPSDGVVSVHSATHPGCQSVLAINSPHAKVHHSLQTSYEVLRILNCEMTTGSRAVDD